MDGAKLLSLTKNNLLQAPYSLPDSELAFHIAKEIERINDPCNIL